MAFHKIYFLHLLRKREVEKKNIYTSSRGKTCLISYSGRLRTTDFFPTPRPPPFDSSPFFHVELLKNNCITRLLLIDIFRRFFSAFFFLFFATYFLIESSPSFSIFPSDAFRRGRRVREKIDEIFFSTFGKKIQFFFFSQMMDGFDLNFDDEKFFWNFPRNSRLFPHEKCKSDVELDSVFFFFSK